jgi:hypothetical protein
VNDTELLNLLLNEIKSMAACPEAPDGAIEDYSTGYIDGQIIYAKRLMIIVEKNK